MQKFAGDFARDLAPEASTILKELCLWDVTFAKGAAEKQDYADPESLTRYSIKLASIKAEVDYLLRDQSLGLKSTTERAFRHLQRLIAVDPDVQSKWSAAFEEGEVKCEKLGAVHLLWHGVFAFKLNAEGQRTDLIFSDPPLVDATRSTLGLVLTEWKMLRNAAYLTKTIEDATRQAARYANEGLADVELRDHRYIVIVSRKPIRLPPDESIKGVTHRSINIAVDPISPSKGPK